MTEEITNTHAIDLSKIRGDSCLLYTSDAADE